MSTNQENFPCMTETTGAAAEAPYCLLKCGPISEVSAGEEGERAGAEGAPRCQPHSTAQRCCC